MPKLAQAHFSAAPHQRMVDKQIWGNTAGPSGGGGSPARPAPLHGLCRTRHTNRPPSVRPYLLRGSDV